MHQIQTFTSMRLETSPQVLKFQGAFVSLCERLLLINAISVRHSQPDMGMCTCKLQHTVVCSFVDEDHTTLPQYRRERSTSRVIKSHTYQFALNHAMKNHI